MAKVKLPKEPSKTRNGALAALWKKIATSRGIAGTLDVLVERYASKSHSDDVFKKTKNTMIRNMSSDKMTWNVFLDILFNALNVRKIDLTVKLYHNNGDESIHTLPIVNGGIEKDDADDKPTDSKTNNKYTNSK